MKIIKMAQQLIFFFKLVHCDPSIIVTLIIDIVMFNHLINYDNLLVQGITMKLLNSILFFLLKGILQSRYKKVLRQTESRFEKYDLVICDELRYITFDRECSELLFTILLLRAGRHSTIIITNLSFDRWQEIFKYPVLTAAMADRLTHKAYIVNMNGNSFRLKETKEWLNKNFFYKVNGKYRVYKNKRVQLILFFCEDYCYFLLH
jgi:hypothetical protein